MRKRPLEEDDEFYLYVPAYHHIDGAGGHCSVCMEPSKHVRPPVEGGIDEAWLEGMSPLEESVFRAFYGLSYIPRTLDYVGAVFGVSRERVRQIEAMALKKLRKEGRRLKDYVEDMDHARACQYTQRVRHDPSDRG